MKADVARQPLIPAFLTLAALVAATMWNVTLPDSAALPTAGIPAAAVHVAQTPDTALALPLPHDWLRQFQFEHPFWSKWIAALLLLLAGTVIGRTSVRYNLYSVSTCLAIPLFGCLGCDFVVDSLFLSASLGAVLLTFAFRNFCRSFCNGYGFDSIFRASLYLGLLALLTPATLPLFLMLPLATMLFRRTLREATVAVAGFLLPGLLFAYVNWGAGGDFLAPLTLTANAFVDGIPFQLFTTLSLQQLAVVGVIVILDLLSLIFFFGDMYAVGSKARLILLFNIGVLVLAAAALASPAADTSTLALLAVPSALLLPFMMVRTHRSVALLFYLVLLGGALLGIFLL